MATTVHRNEAAPEQERAFAVVAGGSMLEAVGGIAVAALAIMALVGIGPALLTAIAGIVFGAAFFIEGMSVAGEYAQIGSRIPASRTGNLEINGGTGVEVLVGLAAIALGVLSLLGIATATLLPALIITGGVGLMLSSGTTERLNDLRLVTAGHDDRARQVARSAVTGGAVAQSLGGIGATVLGILALVAASSAAAAGNGTLAQVGMLVLGVSLALSGGALTGKMTQLYRAV